MNPRRAITNAQKRAVIERIFVAWCERPSMRLGQLLENANGRCCLFYAEDSDLATLVERFVECRENGGAP